MLVFEEKMDPSRREPDYDFAYFPSALKSTGSITRNCGFCYMNDDHCGYHNVPDQPPFKFQTVEGMHPADAASIHEALFHDMSYLDMKSACRLIAEWLDDEMSFELEQIFTIFHYMGRDERPNNELLAQLDSATKLGWEGKSIHKSEVKPWDVLFREICLHYSYYPVGGFTRS
jgi:hypothetical protein